MRCVRVDIVTVVQRVELDTLVLKNYDARHLVVMERVSLIEDHNVCESLSDSLLSD